MPDTGKTVLIVEDEQSILFAAEAILLRGGYSAIAVSSAVEALEKSRHFEGTIHLLLTDVVMPDMDGLTLAQLLVAERPDMRVLLMSGRNAIPSRLPTLKKPFTMAQLLERAATVIDGPPPDAADVFVDEGLEEVDPRAILEAEVERARREYLELSRELLEVTKDVPSAIPNPDGSLLIRGAGEARHKAFEKYQRLWTLFSEQTEGKAS